MSKLNERKRCNLISCQPGQSQSKKSKIEIEYQNTNLMIKLIPMKNRSVNVNKTFKSPFYSTINESKSTISNNLCIQQQIEVVNQDIKNLTNQGYNIDNLDILIEKLHQYNNIKDQTQNILEKIAHIKEVTIKKIHEFYDLDSKGD